MVAKVNFLHVNQERGKLDLRSYHFPLYSCENVYDFCERHVTKIAQRLHAFNEARNLLIKNIAHIHILLNMI